MNKELLIMEDEGFLRNLYAETFEEKGYLVDTATDGMAGLIKMLIHKYDTIYSGVLQPYIDGFNVLDALNKLKVQQGFYIFVTNLGHVALQKKAFEDGADGYFILSANIPDKLVEEITNIVCKANPKRDQMFTNLTKPSDQLYQSVRDDLYKQYLLKVVKKKDERTQLYQYEERIIREVHDFEKRVQKQKTPRNKY